jgi:hypothetical protein
MEIPLPDGLGIINLDATLRCNVTTGAAAFFSKVPGIVEKLDPTLKGIICRSIDTKEAVRVTDQQRMDIGAFFMEAGAFLMQEGMKKMRVCGAASFIAPKFRDGK